MRELFDDYGVHALADGQFGSTGKGVLAAWLAEKAVAQGVNFNMCVSNAGPNSGHTFYDMDGNKHVLKQLPTFAVASYLLGTIVPVYLSAGAIIDPEILWNECARYPGLPVYVNNNAAIITAEDKASEHSGTVAAVAGTRSGTGAALARKVLRDPNAVFRSIKAPRPDNLHPSDGFDTAIAINDVYHGRVFMEISQGFSLGLNSAEFYPKVTSRECTVMQGLADARLPARALTRSYLSMRTYPIRVGNVDGYSSGDYYPDQEETSWEELGQTPELTTVTQRVRRVFTFSRQQAEDAIFANDPDFVFLNFMNYLNENGQSSILGLFDQLSDMSSRGFEVIQGYGPRSSDVEF